MEKIRIGFIGTGMMGQCAHLANYATIPECEVVALAELRQDLAKRVAARYSVPKVYANHEEMLASEKLDAIVAPQPFARHGLLLPELFKAGIPVLSEKPLAGSVQVGEQILDAFRRSKAKYYIGYHKRSDPATMYVKAEIERLQQTGELGKLKYIRIMMPSGDWGANGSTGVIDGGPMPDLPVDPAPPDMDAKTFEDYTFFVNCYIHQVNLLGHLFGENYTVTYADPSGVMLAVQSKSGIAGTIEMAPYVTFKDWQEEAFIAFERGWIKLEIPAPLAMFRPGRVTMYRSPDWDTTPQKIEPQMPWVHAMRQQAINFIKAVQGEQTPLCEPEEAMHNLYTAREYLRLKESISNVA